MAITLCLWLDYNTTAIKNPEMKMRAWYWRLLAFIAAITFTGSIAYSRMFLGVHSLNQVVYGLSLGLWFAMTSEFMLRERLMDLI